MKPSTTVWLESGGATYVELLGGAPLGSTNGGHVTGATDETD
jgi:hypothetical protein